VFERAGCIESAESAADDYNAGPHIHRLTPRHRLTSVLPSGDAE
jgi:hypothetical protein